MNRPVFISFASEDLDVAARIRSGLEEAGMRCWFAPRDIEAGASYPAAITAAVSSCGAVVLLLTESSNVSPHVLSEVELAFNARKPILAVLVAGVVPSASLQYFISTTHWFNAESEFDEGDLARLRTRLAQLLAGERVRMDEVRTRRRLSAGVATAAVLAALAVALYVGWFRAAPAPGVHQPASSPDRATPERAAPPDVTTADVDRAPPGPRSRVNPVDGQTYIWVPPGRFSMGCSPGDSACEPDEMPLHSVRIDPGFWLGRTEVTVAQYASRRGARRGAPPTTDADAPVTGVTWSEAKAYCHSVGGRLPTESEWEYAARAGTSGRYFDTPSSVAWFADNSDERVHPVAGKAPNAFGLHDMLGNVYEWVLDRYYNAYDDTNDGAVEEPLLPNASAVARGGAWTSGGGDVRVSNRLDLPPDAAEPIVGFRCASSEK